MTVRAADEEGTADARLTMAGLARLAGVSASTVSRALAGNPAIRADTRARILALAKAHGFAPNDLARSLRLGRSGALGIMLPTHGMGGDAPVAAMIGALADAAAARGHDVLMWRDEPVPGPASHPAAHASAREGAAVAADGAGAPDGGSPSAARCGKADGIIAIGDAVVPPGRPPVVRWNPAPQDRIEETAARLVEDLLARIAPRAVGA